MDLSEEEQELIAKHRRDKESTEWKPKSDYTAEQKCVLFDSLYYMAYEHYIAVKKNGPSDDDTKEWMFEAVMNLLGQDVWKTYNRYCR